MIDFEKFFGNVVLFTVTVAVAGIAIIFALVFPSVFFSVIGVVGVVLFLLNKSERYRKYRSRKRDERQIAYLVRKHDRTSTTVAGLMAAGRWSEARRIRREGFERVYPLVLAEYKPEE